MKLSCRLTSDSVMFMLINVYIEHDLFDKKPARNVRKQFLKVCRFSFIEAESIIYYPRLCFAVLVKR